MRAIKVSSLMGLCLALGFSMSANATDISVEGNKAIIDGNVWECQTACSVEFDPNTGLADISDMFGGSVKYIGKVGGEHEVETGPVTD